MLSTSRFAGKRFCKSCCDETRRGEVALIGNPAKAKRKLGWTHKIGFNQLIAEMMESDLQRAPRARQRYGPE